MRTRSRLLVGVVAGGLLLTACGDEDATRDGLVRALSDLGAGGGITDEQAECVADALYSQYGEEEISRIADAAGVEEMPPGAVDVIADAAESCGVRPSGA